MEPPLGRTPLSSFTWLSILMSQRTSPSSASNSPLLAAYAAMTIVETRTFWACASGWALDAMDLMMYSLVITIISHQWGVSTGSAGVAASISLLSSALGGWGAGYLSDRFSRIIILQLSVLCFSGFSLLSAFSGNFHQLLICRAFLGLGFGGEWSAGAVLLAETIQPHLRGRVMGWSQAGWSVGWAAAVLIQALLFFLLPDTIAWRAMFAVGALPALIVFFLRRHLEEPQMAAVARCGGRLEPWAILSRTTLRITILAALVSTGAQGGYYAIAFWLPSFLKINRHLSIIGTTPYLCFLIAGSFVGYMLGAWLSDRIGRRWVFCIFTSGASVTVIIYTKAALLPNFLLLLGFPLGVFSCGYYAAMAPFLAELYRTELRGAGLGFAYNCGRGLGSFFPAIAGYLTSYIGLENSIPIFAITAYVVFLSAASCLPETQGRRLDAALR